MSWLVENLLRDKIKIRSLGDIESDEFNDLLVVEKKINDLASSGIISKNELKILDYVSDGKFMSKSRIQLGRHRTSVFRAFRKTCDKVALYLGDYFTDDGYINYMKGKHHLTDEQILKMIKYMNNRFRYKIMRKTNNE